MKSVKCFKLYAKFTPHGPDSEDTLRFTLFLQAGQWQTLALMHKKTAAAKVNLKKLRDAKRKTDPLFLKVLRDETPIEKAVSKIKELVPDKKVLREVFDIWEKASKMTPEQMALKKADIERREAEIANSVKLIGAREAVHHGMNMLHAAAQTGDASAAKLLLASASEATHLLQLLENYKSEIMGNIAAQEGLWPVLASAEAGWEKEALQRIARLKLGADSVKHKVRFHDPRGTDLNLPARRWAKAAVRTLEHTRIRLLGFGQLLRDFGSAEVMADFCLKNGWTRANQPEWADDVAKLPMFTCESLPAWKLVIRKMIREQMPDFHNHPDWQAQRNSAKVSGRETRGEIQNAILDDIASALKRIAPPKEMPKSAC